MHTIGGISSNLQNIKIIGRYIDIRLHFLARFMMLLVLFICIIGILNRNNEKQKCSIDIDTCIVKKLKNEGR